MKRFSLVFVSLLVFTLSISFVNASDGIDEIDNYLSGLVEEGKFSGAVLIAQGDDILLSKGYGMANREWENPNTPSTKFRIASVTKQFTGMGILLLQEQGVLSVDDPICDYLKKCPDTWGNISIANLLTHSSGIPDYTTFPDFFSTMGIQTTPADLIDRFIDKPLDFDPGSQWRYSNSGYILLGQIISEYSAKPYPMFVRKTFFEPLNMVNTGYDNNIDILPHRAEGYSDSQTKAIYADMSTAYSSGALYSTVEDLFIWSQALFNYEVVSQESWDTMWELAFQRDDIRSYGYGMVKSDWNGHAFIGKSGAMPGFMSSLIYFPDDDITYIMLSNIDHDFGDVRNSIFSSLFGE